MRCKSCDVILTQAEMLSSTYYGNESDDLYDLEIIKIDEPDELCFNCRTMAKTTYKYTDREHQFDELTGGLTPSHGFSDDY